LERHDQQDSSGPSTMYWLAGFSSSAVGTNSVSTVLSQGVMPVMARLIVD